MPPNAKLSLKDTANHFSRYPVLMLTEDVPGAATYFRRTFSGAHSPRHPVPHSHPRRLSSTFCQDYSSPSANFFYVYEPILPHGFANVKRHRGRFICLISSLSQDAGTFHLSCFSAVSIIVLPTPNTRPSCLMLIFKSV